MPRPSNLLVNSLSSCFLSYLVMVDLSRLGEVVQNYPYYTIERDPKQVHLNELPATSDME